MVDEHEGWHEITVATPLPMGVAGALMQAIGTIWPESVIRPTEKKQFGVEPVFTMLVPPIDPQKLEALRAQEIRDEAETDPDFESQFTGWRIDENNYAWLGTAPPEELTLFLGAMAHRIFSEMGGINYVEWEVRNKNEDDESGHWVADDRYILTVTKRDGKAKKPHELRMKAEAERDDLLRALNVALSYIDGKHDDAEALAGCRQVLANYAYEDKSEEDA